MSNLVIFIGIAALVINYIFFTIYGFQIILSRREMKKVKSDRIILSDNLLDSNSSISRHNTLPLTVVIPAYNEKETIIQSVNSFIQQNYKDLTLYIVNDGSKDYTMDVCINELNMKKIDFLEKIGSIATEKVLGFYQSEEYPNIYLINKVNGGKSDALNVGINYARTPYISFVDADSFLEKNALLTLMTPFYFSDDIVSIGGLIRPMTRKENFAQRSIKVRTWNLLTGFQYLEYLRSVLVFRSSLSNIDSTVIISGAFGVYKLDMLREINGYDTHSIGEDFDLTLGIRKYIDDHNLSSKQIFIYDSVCWTQPPSTVGDLVKQRSRWQIGFLQTIFKYRKMIFNKHYKNVGIIGLPLFIFTEIISFFMETIGLGLGIYFVAVSVVTWKEAVFVFLLSYFINLFFTFTVIAQNTKIQRIYYLDRIYLLFLAIIEAFSYHWISLYAKLLGTLKFLFTSKGKKHEWGEIKRNSPDNLV